MTTSGAAGSGTGAVAITVVADADDFGAGVGAGVGSGGDSCGGGAGKEGWSSLGTGGRPAGPNAAPGLQLCAPITLIDLIHAMVTASVTLVTLGVIANAVPKPKQKQAASCALNWYLSLKR